MGSVRTNDFVTAGNRYASQHLRAKNGNADAYITKAEAEKLPADLKDNYRAIQGADSNRQVTVKEFKKAWGDTLKTAAKSADADKNGWLTRAENKRLPNNMRDNLAAYMNAVDSKAVKTKTQFQSAVADAIVGAKNNPEKFIELCDPANVQAQRAIGIYNAQYIVEALGLSNSPALDRMDERELLKAITSATFDKRQPQADADGNMTLKGKLKLSDGTELPFTVPVATVNKRLLISPAYG